MSSKNAIVVPTNVIQEDGERKPICLHHYRYQMEKQEQLKKYC
jgi:hypothetical protein